jgi:hypothetical protein
MMNPKSFLKIGGVVLVIISLAGLVGIIGPTPESSIFSTTWYFTNGENWAHLIGGVAALLVAYAMPAFQGPVTLLVGVVALLAGVWGFFLPAEAPNFYGANLENPLDNILHLVVGVWAVLSWRGAKKMMFSGGNMGGVRDTGGMGASM